MRQCAVVFALVALVSCGGGGTNSTPTTPTTPTQANRAPTLTSMNVTPAFGMAGMTLFSYNAAATDPDGDSLTFTWNLAGNAATGTSGTILFSAANTGGTTAASVTVSDGKGGIASDTRSIVLGSMTGSWLITAGPQPLPGSTFTLTQTSAGVVTGSFTLPGLGSGNTDPAQPGRITEGGALSMRVKIGAFTDFTLTGNISTSTGRAVTGTVQGSGFTGQPFTMTAQ